MGKPSLLELILFTLEVSGFYTAGVFSHDNRFLLALVTLIISFLIAFKVGDLIYERGKNDAYGRGENK